MVLTGSAGIKPTRTLGYYVRVYTYKTVKQLLKLPFLKKYEDKVKSRFGSSDYKSASPVMRESLVKVVNEDLQYLMSHIKASTLLVWGDKDDATPLKDGKKMEKLIHDAGLVVFNGFGHYAYLNNLNQFNRVVNYFFTEGVE
jgi:pimeloyl-ACP methyl ester carboxylesterase